MARQDDLKIEIVNKLLKKYESFNVEECIIRGFYNIVKRQNSDADEYNISFKVDAMINLYLCERFRNNPNDETIFDYMDMYYNTCNMIMNKMKIVDANIDDCIMDAIDKYDGSTSFNAFFVKYLKEKILNNEITRKEKVEEINPFIKEAHDLNLLSLIDLNNELLVRYVFMKFGYGNKYCTDEEIRTELNIPQEVCNELFEQMILFVSDVQYKKYNKVKKYK